VVTGTGMKGARESARESACESACESATSRHGRHPLRILRPALELLWLTSDRYIKWRLLVGLAAVAASALTAALLPVVFKFALDRLAAGPSPQVSGAGAANWIGDMSALAPPMLVVLYVAGHYLLRCAAELRTFMHGQAEQRLRRRLGRGLFEHLVRLPIAFHLRRRSGAMTEVAEQGLRGYQLLLTHLVYTILPAALEFSVVAVVLAQLERGRYLLILGVVALAYLGAFRRGAADILAPARSVADAQIEARAVMMDSLLNSETIKYFDAEPVVCERYEGALGRTEAAWRGFYSRRAMNGVIVASIFVVSLGASLLLAVQEVHSGTMTVGDFVLVNAYVVRMVQPLEMLGLAVREVSQGLAYMERMLAVLDEPAEDIRGADMGTVDPPDVDSQASIRSRNTLAFEEVSFGYEANRRALDRISFRLEQGRTMAIVGASGSGKSSLIRLLFRLYEPDAGRILLAGRPIASMGLSALRAAVAVVPQDTVLFHDTIAGNIGFGRPGASLEDIQAAAAVAGLDDFIGQLPEGYDTLVGERGLRLSGGERQRVAIARAVLKGAALFVFDEATSSLDSATEGRILRNLQHFANDRAFLVIAHRLATVAHADEILILEAGSIVERGSHASLLNRNGRYAALWRAQADRCANPGIDQATDRSLDQRFDQAADSDDPG